MDGLDDVGFGQYRVVDPRGIWLPERCVGRGGGYCPPGRDPADVAIEECGVDGWIPDVVSCDASEPGLCWPCLSDFFLVLYDVPVQLVDLDVSLAEGVAGAAVAYEELAGALEAFAVGWLDVEHDEWTDLEVWSLASELEEQRAALEVGPLPARMLRPAVLALAAVKFLYSNVDEPELRGFALDVTTASVRAREVEQ